MKLKNTPKQVRIPINKLTILERIAIEEDKTSSQVIRDAINAYLKNYPHLLFPNSSKY